MKAPRHATRLLVLLSSLNFFNFFDRQLLAALVEPLKIAFQLNDTQIGTLNSAFELTYPVAALLLALLADRWMRSRVIALGVALWSIATLATGAAGSFTALLLSRAALGIGCAAYGPSGLALLSDTFADELRSRMIAIHESGLMLGAAAGFIVGGALGQLFGWRVPFIVAGLPGLALAVLAWRIKEPKRGAADLMELPAGADAAGNSVNLSAQMLRQLYQVRTLWIVYGASVLIAFATGGLIFWLPAFLVRMHGMGLGQAGLLAGIMQVTAGLVGILLGGWLADRWTLKHPAGRLFTLASGFLLGTPLALLAILTTNIAVFGVATALAVVCYTVYFPCIAPQIHDVTRPALRATALAVNIFLSHVLGNLLSAPFIGWLSDLSGSLRIAMLVVPLVAAGGGLIALLGARWAGPEREKMLASLRS